MCHWKKCWTIILSSYNYACNQGQRHVTLILRANLRLLFFFFVNALHAISSCKFDKGPVVLNIRHIARRRKAVLSEIILEWGKDSICWYLLAKSNRYSSDLRIWSSFDLSCVFILFAQKPQQRNHERFHHCTRGIPFIR